MHPTRVPTKAKKLTFVARARSLRARRHSARREAVEDEGRRRRRVCLPPVSKEHDEVVTRSAPLLGDPRVFAFMTDREVRFEDPDFDPDAYLASVSAPVSKPSPESAPFAFAASARHAFAAARDRLGSHAAAAARRAADLAAVASAENDVFLSRVGDVATDAVTLEATLDALHERVDRVSVVARDVGEALRRAESRRVAADDAVRLARHLVGFDACRNRERLRFAVDPVFFDEARAAEAAPLARRLLELATDTREAAVVGSSSRDAVGVVGVRADGASSEKKNVATFLATARDNLEWYCDALEKRLLTTFEDAERAGDDAAATAAAAALETFGRGDALARRFVATREMFMRCPQATPEEDEDDAFSKFSRAAKTLFEDFESIKTDTVAETRRALRLFPEGPASEKAVAALTHRVVEQSVGAALDAALGAAPPPSPLVFVRLASRENDGSAERLDERLSRRARSQESMLRNAGTAGARSAPVSPLKPKTSAAARHRRAASVSVAATNVSRLGATSAAAAQDADDARDADRPSASRATVSFKPLNPPAEMEPVGRDEDARPRGGDEGSDERKTREGDGETETFATRDETDAFVSDDDDDADSDDAFLDDARREIDFTVRDAARAFALAAYLGALAEAHALARRLASDLHAETGGVVRVADALDALFAARRAGYDEMETACLRGLVAARVDGGADHSDDGVLGEEANLSLSTDRRRDTLAEKDGDAAAEALLAARERGVLLEIPRWYGAAAKRVDAVFAPPLAEKAGGEAFSGREGAEDAEDAEDEENEIGRSSTRSARAIAAATSLASAAAAEHRIAEASFEEMTRVAAATTKRAAALCAMRARQLPPATKEEAGDEATRRIAAAAADACLGPACSAVAAVAEAASAARAVSQSRAAAAAARVVSASEAMGGGGDVAASAAAAARATADAASRATAEAAAKFESRAGAAASQCFRAALDAFFGVVDAELKAKLCGKKSREAYAFDFGASADADASFFPGQHASRACASALAHLRRAAETFDEFASSLRALRFGSETSRALLAHELSSRALAAARRHFFELDRFAYSAAGALQLKRDLGEFEAATAVASSSSAGEGEANAGVVAALREKTKKQWRETLEACDVLLVPPDALPGLLKQRSCESKKKTPGGGADARTIVKLRLDFHPSMAEGPRLGLAEKENASARAPHARSASLSSAFFASFRTHSPPPTH